MPLSLSAKPVAIPMQDLCADPLLASAPRMNFENCPVPSLGGIPLLLAKLGQGGMGAVYYGIKVLLRQDVAVKVLPLHLAQQQPDMIARFVREAQIAATIESPPSLIHVTDVNESAEKLFYIVMEFVKGQSGGSCLKKLLQSGEGGMDEANALDMCIAATQGLAAAHAQGVIHRDVKPDNILVPQDSKTGALNLYVSLEDRRPGARAVRRHVWRVADRSPGRDGNSRLHGARTGAQRRQGRQARGRVRDGRHDVRVAVRTFSIGARRRLPRPSSPRFRNRTIP